MAHRFSTKAPGPRTPALCLITPILAAGLGGPLGAQEAKVPSYPRIDLATWYQVDPSWPEKPPSVVWGDMPGVAVDREDQVWLYTRSTPPVQVYGPS